LVNKPATSAIRLTRAEISQWQKDGKCFRYDEFFTNVHKVVYKQIFSIKVLYDDAEDTTPDTTEPTISIHAHGHPTVTLPHHAVPGGHQRLLPAHAAWLGLHPQLH
jgi:hypothetical protein